LETGDASGSANQSGVVCINYVYVVLSNLGSNEISKAGCRWLGKTNWKQFNKINLCKNRIIHPRIIFVGRVVDTKVVMIGLK